MTFKNVSFSIGCLIGLLTTTSLLAPPPPGSADDVLKSPRVVSKLAPAKATVDE